MSKHTPGPWEAELEPEGSFGIEADGMGVGRGLLVIASRNQHPLLAEEMHANARLIAAAPELLEFAQEWISRQGTDINYMTEKARAAIAKATGETK